GAPPDGAQVAGDRAQLQLPRADPFIRRVGYSVLGDDGLESFSCPISTGEVNDLVLGPGSWRGVDYGFEPNNVGVPTAVNLVHELQGPRVLLPRISERHDNLNVLRRLVQDHA